MSPAASLSDLWLTQRQLVAILLELVEAIRTRFEPSGPSEIKIEVPAAFVAKLDQLEAAVTMLVNRESAPAEIVVQQDPTVLQSLLETIATVRETLDALPTKIGEKLNIRIQSGGALGSLVKLANSSGNALGAEKLAQEVTLLDLKRGITGMDTLIEYEKDINPASTTNREVYIGKAPAGTSTSVAAWTIDRLLYQSLQHTKVTKIQEATGKWTDRATLFP